jgi:hypothetical protein
MRRLGLISLSEVGVSLAFFTGKSMCKFNVARFSFAGTISSAFGTSAFFASTTPISMSCLSAVFFSIFFSNCAS